MVNKVERNVGNAITNANVETEVARPAPAPTFRLLRLLPSLSSRIKVYTRFL